MRHASVRACVCVRANAVHKCGHLTYFVVLQM